MIIKDKIAIYVTFNNFFQNILNINYNIYGNVLILSRVE